ncbi:sensor histidine kinase [Bacillus sp. PS06]|uniref:sensor histidine kinase n=1 Tax=Bacillus sp. PS06 TaxID=2764176 RepID=UPI00177D3C4D|nr:sensor histidine kinase [Bacillus sp. PS06]MBD8070654.1 sensor histidine kinase [Bacillus sp. PS06]
MLKIRTRLLLYFAVVLVFIVMIAYIQHQHNEKVLELNDERMDRLFLLNEITRVTNDTFQSLHIYVLDPIQGNLEFLDKHKQELSSLQEQYNSTELYVDLISQKNYQHMITSFEENIDQTIAEVKQQNIQRYSVSLNEAEVISRYIYEMTQDLTNQELLNYHQIYNLVEQKVAYTKMMGTSFFLALITLSLLFALWYSNGISRTISSLTKSAEEISAGNYSGPDVRVSTKDELWFLTKTFNQMKRNIELSVNEIEEKAQLAQLLKETELRSLQNQINPHFLFNTLNTISKTAYIEGAERTSDLISSVSALLRYNLGDLTRPTVLADEVQIVKEYFFIQKSRFGDRVEFIENIDSTCLQTPIPSLTLQPIVENAFIHGVEELSEDAKIELRIYQNDQFVMIEISDNGIGMEPGTIEKLLNPKDRHEFHHEETKGHSNGIGMRNVVERLKLFDKQNEVTISSQLGHGTTVITKIRKTQEI